MRSPQYFGVAAALDGLLRDPRPADEQLNSLGVQGKQHHPELCPIAEYLTEYTLGLLAVSVTKSHAAGEYDETWEPFRTPLPGRVSDFVVEFDRGGPPHLVKRGA